MEKKGGGSERHSYSSKKSRKPTGNSGLFGRVKNKGYGGKISRTGVAPPPTRVAPIKAAAPATSSSGLSKVQQNMLKQAQLHARNTGQTPDKLKALVAQHGNQLKGGGRKGKLKGRPRPGGMQAGGAVPLPPNAPTGRGAPAPVPAPAPAPASSGLSGAQQNLLRQAQEYSQSTGQNPQAVQDLTAKHGNLTKAPQLPGGGRLTPPISGPNPDAGRMQPRRPDAMFKSIRDSLGGPPRPRRGRR